MAEEDDHFAIDSITPSRCSSLLRQHRENGIDGNGVNTSRTTTTTTTTASRKSSRRRNRTTSQKNQDAINPNHPNSNSNANSNSNPSPNSKANSRYNRVMSEHNRSGFSSSLSGSYRSQSRRNKIYQFDDISSLYFDEYGYDKRPNEATSTNNPNHDLEDDDDDTSISDFFKAPTKQELSSELFKLVEPGTSPDKALECLGKLKMWGIVADTDPTTTKYLVEFQAVPTLLYFVRGVMERRRSWKRTVLEDKENNFNINNSNRNRNSKNTTETEENELNLEQAMKVIHHYTCFSDSGTDCKRKSLKSLVLKKAILAQLVEIDGVDLLVNLLEEQLVEEERAAGVLNHRGAVAKTKHQHWHSISKSIWLILMNVGACEHAIQLLKAPRGKHSKARRLVNGIVMALNHRKHRCIMPEWALSSGISDYNETNRNSNKTNSTTSSWMEDLFVTLCRLVGSKDADDVLGDSNNTRNHNLQPNAHDEIRTMLIEVCVVKKCLKALLDEPNTVLGQDAFVTTLAMSFFYACVRFGHNRYKILKEKEHQKRHPNLEAHDKHNAMSRQNSTERMLSVSLDYERLVQFILESIRSFPSHHLIQGNGCLLLEAIPKPAAEYCWDRELSASLASHCFKSAYNPKTCSETGISNACQVPVVLGRNFPATYVTEMIEPCQWFCS